MTPQQVKNSLLMLKSDLDRPSIAFLKHELENIVEFQKSEIQRHGTYLVATAESDLPRLKSAAALNKARLESAQHLLAFFDEGYIDESVKSIEIAILKGEQDNVQ